MGVVYSGYDTETGGMLEDGGHEQRYEQVFQLAIIACDENLNEIETHDIRARRKPNYVPSAGAQSTTGIHPKATDKPKTTEYDMATRMVEYIKENPATIWLGWNSNKFDTPVVRQTQFRSLYDPLPTTSNGNTRADAMRIAKAIYCFATQSQMAFPPSHRRGDPSLKLGNVTAINGINLLGAHDGVNDTRAMIRLCKLMREKDPQAWEHMMNLRTAQGVDSFMQENLVFMWTTPDAMSFGTSAYCYAAHKGQGLVGSTSPNLKKISNEMIIVNLAIDPETWRHRTDRELLLMLKGFDPDEPQKRLDYKDQPFKIIKRNDQPVMWPYMEDPCPIPGDTTNKYTDREREVSRRRDSRLLDLERDDLDARRKSVQDDKELCDRLSILADRMWKVWDDEKKMWVERDKGPKLGEDRIYDAIGLNLPPAENGKLRMLRNWFHSRPFEEREDIAVKIGELIPKPDPALQATDPAKFEQQSGWRDYTTTLKRFALIVLYEKEIADEKPGAYLKNPFHRYWVEQHIYHRLTEPAVDSDGQPLKKPKYRTIDDAERLAKADLSGYHARLDTWRQRGELTPDLAEEYGRRIEMTEACLEYYEEMRANLKQPVRPVVTTSAEPPAPPPEPSPEPPPVPLPPARVPAPAPVALPAPAPTAAFAKAKKSPAKKKPLSKADKKEQKERKQKVAAKQDTSLPNITAIAKAAAAAAEVFKEMAAPPPTQALAALAKAQTAPAKPVKRTGPRPKPGMKKTP